MSVAKTMQQLLSESAGKTKGERLVEAFNTIATDERERMNLSRALLWVLLDENLNGSEEFGEDDAQLISCFINSQRMR